MLLPPQNGGISMTFTSAVYIETIFEIALETWSKSDFVEKKLW
jgi:hypothetical protein